MPIWTNKFNLPETIFNAIKYDPYVKTGTYSITQLIKAPQILQLERRYDHLIERDVSDGLWMLLGSAVHYVLEKGKSDNVLKEELLKMEIGGIRVSGRPDLYTSTGSVEDYKITSVWAFILGDKPDWEAQINLYAHLYRHYGFPVKKGYINAILRDWTQGRSGDDDYPPCPFIVKEIPIWPEEKTDMYINQQVSSHFKSESLQDADLPKCIESDKWTRPTRYALKKKGLKRAVRVFDTLKEAEDYQSGISGLEMEVRKGEDVRCERFCDCKPFCCQYKEEHPI
jgi:hypothetical protein